MDGGKRVRELADRRARPRGGRRDNDLPKPWYLRRRLRLWLAAASMVAVGWKRMRRIV
jgi:hypothetical protein